MCSLLQFIYDKDMRGFIQKKIKRKVKLTLVKEINARIIVQRKKISILLIKQVNAAEHLFSLIPND